MKCRGHLDVAEGKLDAATNIHPDRFLDLTILGQPLRDFVNCHNGGIGSIGHRSGIGNVIKVPMRDQDEIGIDFRSFDRGTRIVIKKRVKKDGVFWQ